MTYREMCEVISEWLRKKHGVEMAPREIFEMDPRGELWPVYELYMRAKADE